MVHAGNKSGRFDDETVVYHSGKSDGEALSTSVLEALDSVPGFDIENSDSVVFNHVDLDALDDLFTAPIGETPRGRVTFPIDDYEVTVTAAGEVIVRAR